METELINEKFKFKLKGYLIYLLMGPFNMPNIRTISWLFMVITVLLRIPLLIFISVGLGLIIHVYGEWKSGSFINWYRSYHYKKLREKNEKQNNTLHPNNVD